MTDQPLRPPAKIHLHPQDELGQIIQKIINDPADELTLVVPDKAILSQGDIAFKVLADRVAQLHKKVTISTANPHIAALAAQAGLSTEGAPVIPLESADTAPEVSAPAPEPKITQDKESIFSKAWFSRHKTALSLTAAFLIVLIGGLMIANYYLPRATIIVYTDNRTIDRDVQLTASPNATAVDSAKMIIPATVVSAEDTVDQEFAATGQKEVGERATGTITITNKSIAQSKTLPAGSVVASAGKSFTTTQSVTISAAAMTEDGIDFTKVNVAIRAVAIGPDYNLAAGSTFAIADFDDEVSGKNAAALSGGSKKSVTVVTAQDRQQALQELTEQAQAQVVKALQAKINATQLLLEDAINTKVSTTDFSHAVDAQTAKFSLTLTVTASSPVVATADIKSLLTGTIEDKVPQGYKLTGAEPKIENAVTKVEDDGTLHLVSTFKAQIVPDLNTASLISQVRGKNPQVVEEFLRSQPNIKGYDITLSPKLPGPLYRLPARESAIKIEVRVEE